VVRLVRSPIDDVLLDEVVDQVRSEYAPSQVALDDLQVRAPHEPVEVEVFRVDLVLILKNIVRNAVLAVGRAPAPRRIALDVQLDLEPTGEEVVRLRVRDTSRESLTTQAIYDRRVDRGLGLVTAALTRYDGAIEVEPGGDGYEKAVVVRFFRALDDESMATGRESAA
jgi:signal transduction histidine kinase